MQYNALFSHRRLHVMIMPFKTLQYRQPADRFTEMAQRVKRAISQLDKLIKRAHQLGDEPEVRGA